MSTFLSYVLAFSQSLAVMALLYYGPNVLNAWIRAIRFENCAVKWTGSAYYSVVCSIFFLMIVGCPKFF